MVTGMLETDTQTGSQLSPTEDGIQVLRELALDSLSRITRNQLPNGLIPASLGRFDDRHFDGKVWIKDHARAVRFALDPLVQKYLPEVADAGKDLYLRAMDGILRAQYSDEQLDRFSTHPEGTDQNGYYSIDDREVPAIKFNSDSTIYHDWGHNQPDNWGTLLLEIGKGIESGWPVLGKRKDGFIPGEMLQQIASYVVNLRTERLLCRSIWEHNVGWPSYSTKKIVSAGLNKLDPAWTKIEQDSQENDYPLLVSLTDIGEAAGSLAEMVREQPGDYTDTENHKSPADLASLVVLNDIDNLPEREQHEIIERVIDADLEKELGFTRYIGDHWRKGPTEAIWPMGKPIMARFRFKQAAISFAKGNPEAGSVSLNQGLIRMNEVLSMISEYGYIPELFEDEDKDGVFSPNNNELAWIRSYIIQAAAAGIAAIRVSQL